MRKIWLAIPLMSAMMFAGCATVPQPVHPQIAFMANIAKLCGKAFQGQIVANEPKSDTPDPFEGQRLVMHVRGCADPTTRLEIPFHVGDDHSRTWILWRSPNGILLKHDHRHRDGSPDGERMYGGETMYGGNANRQEFPIDTETMSMFHREGRLASVTNVWAMEVTDTTFVYELARPGGRLFRVQFDTTKPVELPPTPWGY